MSDAELSNETAAPGARKRRSGIPTGNAGEYFVMGELLRRGFDAQLADRNTQSYDVLVGDSCEPTLRKVQIKTVRSQPWYVKLADFQGEFLDRITIYVLLGGEDAKKPVRYFIARNHDLAPFVQRQQNWQTNGFMSLKAIQVYENCWQTLRPNSPSA